MKLKNLFITLGLASVLGVGVGAGLVANKDVKATEAAVSKSTWGNDAYLVGAFTSWNFQKFTLNNTTSRYEVEVNVSGELKFCITNSADWNHTKIDSGWLGDSGNTFDQNNFRAYVQDRTSGDFYLKETGDYIFYWTAADVSDVCSTFGIEKKGAAQYNPHDSFSLVGTVGGKNWDATDTTYDFTIAQDNLSATLTNVTLTKGEEFKIIADHAWATEYGWSDMLNQTAVPLALTQGEGTNFYVNCSGTYSFALTIDSTTYAVTAITLTGTYIGYKVVIGTTETTLTANEQRTVFSADHLTVAAGETVTFYEGTTAIEGAKAEKVANNNAKVVENVSKVLVDATDVSIYYTVSSKTYWLAGMETGGFHIIKNGTTYVRMTEGSEYGGYNQWYTAATNFEVNDTIQVVNNGVEDSYPVVWTISDIEESELSPNFTYDSVQDVVKCVKKCSVQVYLKTSATLGDKLYFGPVSTDVEEAVTFAEGFITNINNGACNGGEPVRATLENAWAAQKQAYNALSSDNVRALLTASSSVEEIRTFVTSYQYVLARRGAKGTGWNIDDFANLGTGSYANFNTIGLKVDDSAMLIVVISSIGVISAAGLFFIIKRRRQLHK